MIQLQKYSSCCYNKDYFIILNIAMFSCFQLTLIIIITSLMPSLPFPNRKREKRRETDKEIESLVYLLK